jgi:putative mRNA 3-end processing factor
MPSAATWLPAGHVLGSAQILLEHRGEWVVVTGDFKRRPDPTCAPFAPTGCDVPAMVGYEDEDD